MFVSVTDVIHECETERIYGTEWWLNEYKISKIEMLLS